MHGSILALGSACRSRQPKGRREGEREQGAAHIEVRVGLSAESTRPVGREMQLKWQGADHGRAFFGKARGVDGGGRGELMGEGRAQSHGLQLTQGVDCHTTEQTEGSAA